MLKTIVPTVVLTSVTITSAFALNVMKTATIAESPEVCGWPLAAGGSLQQQVADCLSGSEPPCLRLPVHGALAGRARDHPP